ncbi:MAG: hypothetical protein sL5_04600 [Candidatus Mesenet longicola]|uniref:Uncharacterized protein n=1 Tax=Candidatus Mesenet longicola TaxID=1892558 RepID=A0A8J3HUG9_9RICK|nr:MAG: hypothetical protein sGL2_04710 [Candidatus Mesenet longicola]GHM59467.1 MAG: hypothetical protein sL5_04600 [Candidatus Mesenet longicola]
MIGKTQGKIDDQTSLKEVIERKLNLKDNETLRNYYGTFESEFKDNYEFFISGHFSRHFDRSSLKDKIIILTLKEYYLSCPFLLQSDLADDILEPVLKEIK